MIFSIKCQNQVLNFVWNTLKNRWNETDDEILSTGVSTIFSELLNLFSLVPVGNFLVLFQATIYMYIFGLKKIKKGLQIIMVSDFCWLKSEIAPFSVEFN